MDYSAYKQIDFQRKYWKFLGIDINVLDSNTNAQIGFISQRTFKLKSDVFVYTDKSMNASVVELKKQSFMSTSPKYSMINTQNQTEIGVLQFNNFRSAFVRWHIDVMDANGNTYGYVQETSSGLAILRRILGMISPYAELILSFVPQTFDIYYAPNQATKQLIGRIVHRKNPLIVKMHLDLSQGQAQFDPK
jgi:hypothetical protein